MLLILSVSVLLATNVTATPVPTPPEGARGLWLSLNQKTQSALQRFQIARANAERIRESLVSGIPVDPASAGVRLVRYVAVPRAGARADVEEVTLAKEDLSRLLTDLPSVGGVGPVLVEGGRFVVRKTIAVGEFAAEVQEYSVTPPALAWLNVYQMMSEVQQFSGPAAGIDPPARRLAKAPLVPAFLASSRPGALASNPANCGPYRDLDISIVPSLPSSPKRQNSSATLLFGLCLANPDTLQCVAPISGRVTFDPARMHGTGGGHEHDLGSSDPLRVGTYDLSASQITIGLGQFIPVIYRAPQAGGHVSSVVRAIPDGPYDPFECELKYTVSEPGLLSLSSGGPSPFGLIGSTNTHPDSHYVTSSMASKLSILAAGFFREAKKPLFLNDASLPFGGVFEARDSPNAVTTPWTPPHKGHRIGRNTDVAVVSAAKCGSQIPKQYCSGAVVLAPAELSKFEGLARRHRFGWLDEGHSSATSRHYHLILDDPDTRKILRVFAESCG
jgi:hypothetical protein